jgi:LPS sulfotransferase NodH
LCESLKNTGLAGVPEEYFLLQADEPGFEFSRWSNAHNVHNQDEFIEMVKEKGTTSNGVFGSKMMWNYFPETMHLLRKTSGFQTISDARVLQQLFPNLRYIWITRNDKVRQAVSWSIAAQSNVYASWMGEVREEELTFDFSQIDNLHRLVLEGESGWRAFFNENNIEPFHVTYEALVNNYEGTAKSILDFLSIEYPANLVFSKRKLRKQANALNDAWVEKYLAQKEKRS